MVARTNVNADSTESFVYDGENIALILNSSGGVIERELDGPAVDQVMASEAGAATTSETFTAGMVDWYLADNQGSVRDVAQYSGGATTIVDHVIFDSFGQATQGPGFTSDPLPEFTYNGTWQDPNTGLNKMGLRWDDAVDDVFLSQDPADLEGGPNGFGGGQTNTEEYCGNSPTNGTDPSGLETTLINGQQAAAIVNAANGQASNSGNPTAYVRVEGIYGWDGGEAKASYSGGYWPDGAGCGTPPIYGTSRSQIIAEIVNRMNNMPANKPVLRDVVAFELSGHQQIYGRGVTIGRIGLNQIFAKDGLNRAVGKVGTGVSSGQVFAVRAQNYLNATNFKTVLGALFNAKGIRIVRRPNHKPLLVLNSCNLGLYTRLDEKGKPVSLQQLASNFFDIEILSPGGFSNLYGFTGPVGGAQAPQVTQVDGVTFNRMLRDAGRAGLAQSLQDPTNGGSGPGDPLSQDNVWMYTQPDPGSTPGQ
jgi:RHS repeat-associated protein